MPSGVLSYFNSNCTFKGYAITKNLYNATLSNSAWYTNSSYTATVTPSSGYTITSVTVKMNNVDITSTAYSAATKTITISSVTGPITITVYTTNKKYKGILVIKNPYTSVVISKQAPVSPVPPVQPEPEPEPEPYPYSEI